MTHFAMDQSGVPATMHGAHPSGIDHERRTRAPERRAARPLQYRLQDRTVGFVHVAALNRSLDVTCDRP
jgi:hypothetical protein